MKGMVRLFFTGMLSSLYPTWFRWKDFMSSVPVKKGKTLYPTWFRWKKRPLKNRKGHSVLYIPHGSDERYGEAVLHWHVIVFISHMVQMKGLYVQCPSQKRKNFISHMVQMKVNWFVRAAFYDILYIPHGSDERDIETAPFANLISFISHMVQMKAVKLERLKVLTKTLYPTWFRWKLITLTYPSDFPHDFISHMVQMKVYAIC